MKRLLAAMLMMFCPFQFAMAGDFAKRHIHGFSMDGGLFAFEEYGIQDGSGFPYANIYVIDTETDTWTANSPFRVRIDDETASVWQAREQARMMAGPVMKSFEDRGNVVATNRPGELTHDRKHMVAHPRLIAPALDDTIEFRLKTKSFDPSETCEAFGRSIGFELLKIGTEDGEVTRTLHEDSSIPSSRNCPLDYDLADIVTYYPDGGDPVLAVLILVRSVGFEGPDGRYLAVTSNLHH